MFVLICAAVFRDHVFPKRDIQLNLNSKHLNGFKHPTHVIKRGQDFIVAQMHSEQLYRITSLAEPDFKAHSPSDFSIDSPHFLVSYKGGVFVSEGRGSRVVYINEAGDIELPHISDDLNLNRPHGLCIDKQDWLYIADSVNSRLLRVHLKSRQAEVFQDLDKRIAYARQILCRDDGIWLANSYEKAFKLNQGRGGNVLKISNFADGSVEEMVAYPKANVTGIEVIDDSVLLVGRWSGHYDLVAVDLSGVAADRILMSFERELDAPYGITLDEARRKVYISYLGINRKRLEGEDGGVVEFAY